MTDIPEEEPVTEIIPGRWSWMALPLAGFGFAGQIADAWGTLFSNLSFAVGAHMKYMQQQAQQPTVDGPIFKD